MKKIVVLCISIFQIMALNSSNIDFLKEKYAWPLIKPVVALDSESMFSNVEEMKEILKNNNIYLIIELGSWLGASARFMLDYAPNATLIAIDHWQGSKEHAENSYWAAKLANLYETFLLNCWRYKNRLIPLKTTVLDGLTEVYNANLQPDLIYVDASHDYEPVTAELEKCFQLFPNSHIVGDDWYSAPLCQDHF